ncbi:prepilin-type N-terminal cleavage/methylation domain-containing protein [bacterium]|nr:prepilin-type N-terminal cleavage/methylation domain-containing protein [bacterium]
MKKNFTYFKKLNRNESGFTLFELTAGLAIFGMSGLILSTVLVSLMDIYSISTTSSYQASEVSRVAEMTLRDIRQAQGDQAINAASSSSLMFVNRNNDTETFTYSLQEEAFWRTISNGQANRTDTLLYTPGIQISFAYLDSNGQSLNTNPIPVSLIREVRLNFSLATIAGNRLVTAKTQLRNLR